MDGFWYLFLSWLLVGLDVALLVIVFLRRNEPSAVLAWSLAIVSLPIVGAVAFLLFGFNRVPRRVVRRLRHREGFEHRARLRDHCEQGGDDGAAASTEGSSWAAVAEMLESAGEPPPRRGNEVRLYSDGSEAYREIAEAIRSAEHHVHIESYILRDDDIGRALVDLLVEKCREGVFVRLLVDGVGSLGGLRLLRRVRREGGAATTFLPILSPGRISPNLRNHRKIVVCDGHTGFFGGLNVGEEYVGRRRRHQREWYDLHMRLRGPAVRDLQNIFIEDWDFCTGETLEPGAYLPPHEIKGDESAQVIAGGPYFEVNPIRQAFLGAFSRARAHILLATPYVAPDLALRDALKTAARTGVEVSLITQSFPPDSRLVYYCGQYFLDELIEAGVRVFVYGPGMMHAKAVAIDGEWAMLGTANLDNRSMFLNFEMMTVFHRCAAARGIETELLALRRACVEVGSDEMARRTRVERLLAAGARLFAPLL